LRLSTVGATALKAGTLVGYGALAKHRGGKPWAN
jgi:hypothetical protein